VVRACGFQPQDVGSIPAENKRCLFHRRGPRLLVFLRFAKQPTAISLFHYGLRNERAACLRRRKTIARRHVGFSQLEGSHPAKHPTNDSLSFIPGAACTKPELVPSGTFPRTARSFSLSKSKNQFIGMPRCIHVFASSPPPNHAVRTRARLDPALSHSLSLSLALSLAESSPQPPLTQASTNT
jgi:hypothetical protein